MDNTRDYRFARRTVERRIGLWIHLAVYVLVNTGLVIANLIGTPLRPWALGPLLGWGIGLLFHGLAVWLHAPGAKWKHRMIEYELNKRRQ